MAKMTLLDMTQNILSSMDSDEVNSIRDTVESMQIAEVIKETYYEVTSTLSLPEHKKLIQLEAVSDINRPTYMRIPDNVYKVEWIKYDYETDGRVDYREITYISPQEFLKMSNDRASASDLSTVTVNDFSGVTLCFVDTENPKYWTTFDDQYIIFDSYNKAQDTTLQQSKSAGYGWVDIPWEMEDDFIPPLDANLFPLLLSEAKSVSWLNYKQMANQKEEMRSRRQRVRAQNDLWRGDQRRPYRYPDYGRRSRK